MRKYLKSQRLDPGICVVVICIVAIVVLILILSADTHTPIDKYSLSFKGDLSLNNGNLTLTVYNNESGIGKSTPKTLSIYGLNTKPNILVTDLVDKKGNTIKSTDITIHALQASEINNTVTVMVEISIDKIQKGGVYQGSLIISTKNTNSSIPIMVETEPLLDPAICWVLIGVSISIIFWEIINYFSQCRRQSQRKALEAAAAAAHEIDSKQHSDLKLTEYMTNLQAAAIIRVKEEQYNKRYSPSLAGTPRQLILNVGSAFFGILVGLLALLNSDYINGLRVIDFNAAVVLLGIGLGIGSLKEFVDKASS